MMPDRDTGGEAIHFSRAELEILWSACVYFNDSGEVLDHRRDELARLTEKIRVELYD